MGQPTPQDLLHTNLMLLGFLPESCEVSQLCGVVADMPHTHSVSLCVCVCVCVCAFQPLYNPAPQHS